MNFFLAKMASSKKAARKMLVKLDSIKGSRSALFAAGAGVSIVVLIMALVLPGMTFYFSQSQTAVLQLIFLTDKSVKPLFYIIFIFIKLGLSVSFDFTFPKFLTHDSKIQAARPIRGFDYRRILFNAHNLVSLHFP